MKVNQKFTLERSGKENARGVSMGCVCEVLSASFRPPRNSIIQLQVEERTLQRLPELRGSLGEFRRGKILSAAALKDARESSDGIRRQASSAFCNSRFREARHTSHGGHTPRHSSSFYNYMFLFAVFQDQPDGGKYADGASRRGTCPGSNPPTAHLRGGHGSVTVITRFGSETPSRTHA